MPCDLDLTKCTLLFPNSPLGDSVVGWKTNSKLATEPNVRQNFWANRVIIDGRYPALYHQHEFIIYVEKNDPRLYAKQLFDYQRTLISSSSQTLKLYRPETSTDVIAFGSCYMLPVEQNSPEDLFLFQAGYMRFQFWGTEVPSVITTP